MRALAWQTFVTLALLTGCPADDDGGGTGNETGTTASTGSDDLPGTSTGMTMSSTTMDPTGTVDESSGDTAPEGECVLWNADECGEDRKCMPYSTEADRIPDEIQCCDAVDDPAVAGDPCMAMDYNGSCLDNCAQGSMCLLDDEDTLSGHCREFCNPGQSQCEPDQTCKSFFELLVGVPTVPLCMEKCDPLIQNCTPDNWHCIPDTPTESGQSGFLCSPPPPSTPKGLFDTCALANDCEPGLVCVTAQRVPDCGFTSCCTAYCSLSEGNAACTTLHPDLRCVDWMSPDPDWQDVGACAIPS